MKRLFLCALVACGASAPPLGDSDAARPILTGRPVARDAGAADAGETSVVYEFQGQCPAARSLAWRWFDFLTKTPKDSALVFVAQSAPSLGELETAPSVMLGTVTGPDLTAWTGVDVEPKLKSIGQRSELYLRVTATFVRATDGTAPTLVDTRQQYDCLTNQ